VVSKPSGEMYVFMVLVLFGFCGINAWRRKCCVIAMGFMPPVSRDGVAGFMIDGGYK